MRATLDTSQPKGISTEGHDLFAPAQFFADLTASVHNEGDFCAPAQSPVAPRLTPGCDDGGGGGGGGGRRLCRGWRVGKG